MITRSLIAAMVPILILFGSTSYSDVENIAELQCDDMYPVINHMLQQHLLYKKYNSNIEARAIDQYIKGMDGAKMYFYKSDIKKLTASLKGIYKKLIRKDCGPLDIARNLYLKRVKERAEFAKKYLTRKDFKVDKNLVLILDSDEREYPNNENEANEFQKKYIQWQIANFIASDMKLEEALERVTRRYRRAYKNLTEEKKSKLYATYLDSVARALDPHSSYFSQEHYEDFQISMKLSLEGIGATLSSQDGYTVIEQLIPGGAAADSGQLDTQDKIIAVGQGKKGPMEPIIDMPLQDVVRLIRGPKGTKVRLNILRQKGKNTNRFIVTLNRKKINLTQEEAKIYYSDVKINGSKKKIGILNLPSFYADSRPGGKSSYEDVKKLLKEARKNKVDGLVLDLAANGGGSLEDAVKLTGLFFGRGNVVKTQAGRRGFTGIFGSEPYYEVMADKDPAVQYSGPLVVLTSRLSASASEIVSGALQDYDRAVVVGADHTFGKGSVQSVVILPRKLGGGAFKVTVGMFFVPGGKSTQHRGVSADIVLPGIYSTEEVGEKSLDYSLAPKTIKPFVSPEARVGNGKDAWTPIQEGWLSELRSESKARVSTNKKFDEIKNEMKEAKEKGKELKIADVLDKKEEKQEAEKKRKRIRNDEEFRRKEYLNNTHLVEAINVLNDLISLQNKGLLADKAGQKAQPVKN